MTLQKANTQGDSLVGVAADETHARIAVPIAAIRHAEKRQLDVKRSIALAALTFVALRVVMIIVIIANTPYT